MNPRPSKLFSSTLIAAALLLVVGCKPPTDEALRAYELAFRCTPTDFSRFEGYLRREYASRSTMAFTSVDARAFSFAETINQLLHQHCSAATLDECAPGSRARASEEDGPSALSVNGAIEAFSIRAVATTEPDSAMLGSVSYLIELKDPAQFQKAIACFKAAK